jgi:hypothetical protein
MSIIQVLLGGNCQRQKIVQSAMEHAAMAAYPKEFASMTGGLRLGITMSSIINESQFINGWGAKPASTIGWGERSVFMIGWEAESMKSQTIG